jgi:threonine synthase
MARVPSRRLRSEPLLRCRECGRDAPAGRTAVLRVVLRSGRGRPARSVPRSRSVRTRIAAGPLAGPLRPLLPAGSNLERPRGRAGPRWWPAEHARQAIGIPELWVKDETANPTGSFKDRVVEVAVARGLAARSAGRGLLVDREPGPGRCCGRGAPAGLASVSWCPTTSTDAQVAIWSSSGPRGRGARRLRRGEPAGRRGRGDLDRWAWVNVTLRPWYELGARTVGGRSPSSSGGASPTGGSADGLGRAGPGGA